LNEVGGDPAQFGVELREFHRDNAARLERWPHAMLASSTHDTKRSEDVRARISVLSEMPRFWRSALNRWARFNRKYKTRIDGVHAPDRNDECLLYQTLLGAWPLGLDRPDAEFVNRMDAYLLKAIREAQAHSSWINPNAEYDGAASAFVRAVLDRANRDFLEDFVKLRDRVAFAGAFNSLTQQALKLTVPGVPDIYQGTELWDFSLVDPDNRRPVDFETREQRLADLDGGASIENWTDGRIKLFLTHRLLGFRREHPELFSAGAYIPLNASGAHAEHVIAFARQLGGQQLIVAAPRFIDELTAGSETPPLGDVWGETRLALPKTAAGARFRDLFTGVELEPSESRDVDLAALLAEFPVAVLARIIEE
jgi:(1->4)-alpha-D-glucan 1-alpha-D-glucosylmutase